MFSLCLGLFWFCSVFTVDVVGSVRLDVVLSVVSLLVVYVNRLSWVGFLFFVFFPFRLSFALLLVGWSGVKSVVVSGWQHYLQGI